MLVSKKETLVKKSLNHSILTPSDLALHEQLALKRLRRIKNRYRRNELWRRLGGVLRVFASSRLEREIGPGQAPVRFDEITRAQQVRVRFL
jgi:hypothetical protein